MDNCGCTYDLEGVSNNPDSHELFTVVAAVHHEGVGETLDDRALGLAEALDGIATSGMGDVDGCSDLDVVAVFVQLGQSFPFHFVYGGPFRLHLRQGDIPDLDLIVAPLVEELGGANLSDNLLGEDGVLRAINFDFAGVGHCV